VARVVAFIPDLLFGSNVLGALSAEGHETVLVSDQEAIDRELPGAQALVVDLTADPESRIEQVSALIQSRDRVKTLAFYSHVEQDVRARAEQAGFDLVIPRSRMAREGAAIVTRLVESAS
jgi:nucleoside-diphosphate-sugar epimerase